MTRIFNIACTVFCLVALGLPGTVSAQLASKLGLSEKSIHVVLQDPLQQQLQNSIVQLKGADEKWVHYSNSGEAIFYMDTLSDAVFQLSAHKDQGLLNGITVADLIGLQRHIMNLQPFETPWQWLAADLDRSNTLDEFDVWQLEQLLLGTQTNLERNESYRFIPADHVFAAYPLDWPIPDVLQFQYENQSNHTEKTLVMEGIKIGDVDGSSYTDSNEFTSISLETPTGMLSAGDELIFQLNIQDALTLQGLQMELTFDSKKISIEHLVAGNLPDMSCTHIAKSTNNSLAIAWYTVYPEKVAAKSAVLFIKIKATADCTLDQLFRLRTNRMMPLALSESGTLGSIRMALVPAKEDALSVSSEKVVNLKARPSDVLQARGMPAAW